MKSAAVVLAAGKGTRMKSKLPKVLHNVLGKPMITHVLESLSGALIDKKIVVLGHKADLVEEVLNDDIQIAYQREQLGTGHAVKEAKDFLTGKEDKVLVLCGDTPLLTEDTLIKLMKHHEEKKAIITILTAEVDNPFGYGRIVRGEDSVEAIVEEKDASIEEKSIKEINTGAYCFSGEFLYEEIDKLTNDNSQGEYYLTDLVKKAASQNLKVESFVMTDYREALGINNRVQLAEAESIMKKRIAEKLMVEGVTIIDPLNTYIGKDVKVGEDTVIYPGCILEGKTNIGKDCVIGPNTRIVNSLVKDSTSIQYTVILESEVGSNCNIGPFAYLRPGTVLEDKIKIGDFVEIKKSTISTGSKVPHLSYVGDSYVGRNVNIGCGTITCNYDGKNKHKTTIHDNAFIGSNTNLVAPVTIGEGAVVGAGSTITKDVPKDALGLGRQKQRNIDEWSKKRHNK